MTKIYNSITEMIGNTPLLRLNKLSEKYNLNAEILLKLEFFNPLSSVKDRIGLAMIDAAEKHGAIAGETHFVEPTSGNTGIALAFVAKAKGFDITLVMPESMSMERRKMLKFLGANLELTPADKGMGGAIKRAEELVKQQGYVQLGQFENPANPEIHTKTTAQEILNDTDGNVDVFVAGVGTGGTINGVGNVLKKHNPNVKIIAVEPEDSPVLSGGSPGPHKIQGIGAGFVPENYDASVVDEVIQVGNESAFSASRELALLEGVPAGISSGANISAVIEIASRPEMAGKKIVVIAASSSERYISTMLFDGL
ncbi:MAG: cysteine synthase A [Alphaproteobacteria bacterium]